MSREYIQSDFELLPLMPVEWNLEKNKRIYEKKKNIVGDNYPNYSLLSLTKKGIKKIEVEDNKGKKPGDYGTYQIVNKDDLVLCLYDLDVSAVFVGYCDFEGIISPSYLNLKSSNKVHNKFSYYWFLMNFFDRRYKIYSKSIRFTINNDNFMSLSSPLPSLEEQKAISKYLDDKTNKIDELIKVQEDAIVQLIEYKEALIQKIISNTVFHRDDIQSAALRKKLTRLDSICQIVRGNCSFKKDELKSCSDFVGLQYGKVYKVETVDESYNHFVDKKFYKANQVVKNEDTIIVSTSETLEDLGHSCYYNRTDEGLLGGEQMVIKPNTGIVISKYLYYLSKVFSKKLRVHATGLKVYRFNTGNLKRIFINIPEKNEQKRIVDILDKKIPEINQLINQKKSKIDKLNEYKKSLIYEAVTGKIEVM